MQITRLNLSWSISRGLDTYGYNICRLDDGDTGQRFRCMGGGYDMVGAVFGMWLESRHQTRLREYFAARQGELVPAYAGRQKLEDKYGAFVCPDGSVKLDGGCGLSCMTALAQAIGLGIDNMFDRKKRSLTGWLVYPTDKVV